MSGLRETKKAATRTTLARAAARIALVEGAEGLTVAAVSTAAGVSPRTFHNYFSSMEEALVEFIVERTAGLVAEFHEVPTDTGLLAAVEQVLLAGLREDLGERGELDSFVTIFQIGDVLQTLVGAQAQPDLARHLRPVFDLMRPWTAGRGDFEAQVAIQVAVIVARTALETYYELPEPREVAVGEALVRRAFAVVRLA
ncbi:MAG TPA: TetR family transcriptional regulator [Corynebacterium sp.]|nr:TetR family transcriptional regulator [Corynebacterium sp.]